MRALKRSAWFTGSLDGGEDVPPVPRTGGVLGEFAALTDELKRCQREEETASWREEQNQLEALVAPVEELCEAAETIVRATLLAAGFKRHNRGEWRRRRDQGTNAED